MADVFLSYARDDVQRVEALDRALTAHGISVWRDKSALAINDRFDEKILEEITQAQAVIVCWSEAAGSSRWVKDEANEAHRLGKYVGCLITPSRPPMGFGSLHSIDLCSWDETADDLPLLDLLEPVGKLLKNDQIADLAKGKRIAIAEEKALEAAAAAQRVRDELEKHRQEVEAQKRRELEAKRRELDRQRSAKENAVRAISLFYFAANPFLLALAFSLLTPASPTETHSDDLNSAETLAIAIGWLIPWLITSGALWYAIAQPGGGRSIGRWVLALALPWAFVAWMSTQTLLPLDIFIRYFLIAVSVALVLAIVTASVRGKGV